MTAQITDVYKYKDRSYTLVATEPKLKFDPEEYGFQPEMISTASWDGYWSTYKIDDEHLVFDELTIKDANNNYPKINDVEPQIDNVVSPKDNKEHPFKAVYKNINLPIDFTGKILLGDKFINEYYVHMGYQSAWAYEDLIEFTFIRGKMLDKKDLSEFAEKMRESMKKDPQLTKDLMKGKTEEFINKKFSKKYEDKVWWE